MSAVDTWLADGRSLATIHMPEGTSTTTGVVIVPGMGQEHVISYRTLRLFAQGLEAEGIGAIRYSHIGHGDSSVTGPVPSLLEGARLAAKALREAGFTRVVYVGLASAAPIAAAAAADDSATAGLVLWDPPETGKRWLRRARSLYATSVAELDRRPDDSGHVTIVGLELTATEVAAYTALIYDATVADRMPVLLALREGPSGPVPTAFTERLGTRATMPIDVVRVTEHESLLDVSSVVAKIPGDSVIAVVDWIAATFGDERTSSFEAQTAIDTAVFPYRAEGGADPVLIEERIVRIGPDRLFAIESLPQGAPNDIPAVVLQAGSAEHRIGATRHQVTLARELAANGFRAIRLDRRGTGESGTVAADEANLLYAQEWLEDNENAVRHLALPRERVGVAGLCSGGWLALMTDPELAKVIIGVGVGTFEMKTALPGEVAENAPRVTGETSARRTPLAALVKGHMPYWGMQLLAKQNRVNIAQPLLHRVLGGGSDLVLLMTPADQESFADRLGNEAVKHLASDPGNLTIVRFDHGDHALFESSIRDEVIHSVVEQTVHAFGDAALPKRLAGTARRTI